jgi:hypothetical protein
MLERNQMPQDTSLCRFCLESRHTLKNPLLKPCSCRGTLTYVHLRCLNKWRNTNIERNGDLCHLCMTAYTLPEPFQLENIPEENNYIISVIKHPILISFFIHYIWVFDVSMRYNSTSSSNTYKNILDLYIFYQALIQLVFLCLFFSQIAIRNKRGYILGWGQEKRYFYFLIHASLVILLQNGIWISGLTMNLFLGIYWRTHVDILVEINERILIDETATVDLPFEDEESYDEE